MKDATERLQKARSEETEFYRLSELEMERHAEATEWMKAMQVMPINW